MLLSIKWLTEMTPYSGSIDELAHLLTMLGLEVEEIQKPFACLEDYVLGRVVSCQPHPNADKLRVCSVDMGASSPESIVCGAQNVARGHLVPVAPVGSTLPEGQRIEEVRIRGELSAGMILSEREMGLGEDHSGIMTLDSELPPGTPLTQALDLDTLVFDLGITPNRADCLSVLGVAREVAAVCNLPLHMPGIELSEAEESSRNLLQVEIDDPQLCPLYQARLLEEVTLGQSPRWLRYRLISMGVRPINNIVDVTNYVMLEMGQPLHAFDRTRLQGGLIRVALARPQERMTTLDGQERRLSPDDLLIWDAEKPVAMAGVMGGANSEITSTSSSLVLESAVFDPATIRSTSRRMGLSSESSYRFERGVDHLGSGLALDRAAALIHSLAGGRILRDQVRAEPRPWQKTALSFRPHKARSLLALDVDDVWCAKTLRNLGCMVHPAEPAWQVTPPSFRLDLCREVDLFEEIGRVYGLEAIPTTLPRINKPLHPAATPEADRAQYAFVRRIKAWAQGLGLTEVINYSFVGAKDLDRLHLPQEEWVAVHNPLSADQNTMRTALTPGLMRSLRTNVDQGTVSCRLFEIARIFVHDPDSETTVSEHTRFALLLSGNRHPNSWSWSQEECDYLDIKGVVEHLMQTLQLAPCSYSLDRNHPFAHPAVTIMHGQTPIGFLGRLHPEIAKFCHAKGQVWVAEMDMDYLSRAFAQSQAAYTSWAKYPPVHRDMTLIAGTQVSYASIKTGIQAAAQDLLEDCRLIDLYRPQDQEERHLTLRMRYRHPHKTLTDKEVDREHAALGQALLSQLPIRFPGS